MEITGQTSAGQLQELENVTSFQFQIVRIIFQLAYYAVYDKTQTH